MKLVIVESPAKSKTLSKYLGNDYKIVASFGHVRDLPSKNGSVDPENNFAMHYQIKDSSAKAVSNIVSNAKAADIVYIASDPDREGEAIAWNIEEILKEKKVKTEIRRVTFNEITKSAVLHAIKNPRDVDSALVDAQQSRLSLDYLVGFNLSPVLWKKLPNSRSAGRVQSVALRMIVDREEEIRAFIPSEYWSIECLVNAVKTDFPVKVTQYGAKKFSNSYPKTQDEAEKIANLLKHDNELRVISVDTKDVKRSPYAPFNTAALQQDASNKLGFPADKTMKIAQGLYEGVDIGGETRGLITYMRTDGTTLSNDALDSIRSYIKNDFGAEYLVKSPRIYKTKTKNAQEAHEAIRPTDVKITPHIASKYIDKDALRLYTLIWNRAVACQMSDAIFARQAIDLESNAKIICRANGNVMKFDGFLKLYEIKQDEDEGGILPNLQIGDITNIKEINPKQHFTASKPRFTEASLIKELEEKGIGRPSTYATIIKILQDRDYVALEKRQFHPQPSGIVVTQFLKLFFTQYVEYNFTAKLEEELDIISDGKLEKITFLKAFWDQFNNNINQVMEFDYTKIGIDIARVMQNYLFSGTHANEKKCTSCTSENISIKIGKYGLYINCSDCGANISFDKYINTPIKQNGENGENMTQQDGLICQDETGNNIFKKTGRFGDYLELQSSGGEMIKRSSIPDGFGELTQEKCRSLVKMPYTICKLDGEDVAIGIGKYGPYLLVSGKYYTIPRHIELTSIDENSAREIIANAADKKSTGAQRQSKTSSIGNHPKSGEPISVGKSRYGVYVLYKKKFYGIKEVQEPSEVTLQMALDVIDG